MCGGGAAPAWAAVLLRSAGSWGFSTFLAAHARKPPGQGAGLHPAITPYCERRGHQPPPQKLPPPPLRAPLQVSFGALGDSFYEYLLKMWLLGGRRVGGGRRCRSLAPAMP